MSAPVTAQASSTVVVASREEGFETRLADAFDGQFPGEVHVVDDLGDPLVAVDRIARMGADVVVIGPGLSFDEWVALAEAFEAEHPEICVMLVAEPTPKLWEAAVHTGVRDVVAPTGEDKELRLAVERSIATVARQRANLLGEGPASSVGQVMVVFGPKGGVGKTTVSTNLAVGLAIAAPRDVVLVDLDLRFGDVAHAMRLESDRTIADVLRFGADRDVTSLKAFLTPHPSGLYVLCAPDSPAEIDEMEPERVGRVIRALGEAFPYVVVDTGAGLDEFTLSAAEVATDFVLVGVTDVPSVRSTRKALEVLDRIGMTSQARHFVLNRSDREVGLGTRDIEQTVGLDIDVSIPSTTLVTVSVNQGMPLLAGDEPSEPADALLDLVGRFVELPVDNSKALFSKRKGRGR